jgi:bifunctional non-homologous end joining protein LigD
MRGSHAVAKVNASERRPRATRAEPQKRRRPQLKVPPLREFAPELATLSDLPPRSGDWIYETKYDGYRILARVQNGQAELVTRNGHDFSARAPQVAETLAKLSTQDAVFDGELVSPSRSGKASGGQAGDFQALQNALREGRSQQLIYYVFDCLFAGGEDLRALPLLQRKEVLKRLLPKDGPVIKRSQHLTGSGAELLGEACKLGFEGIIAKRSDAPYRAGRGKSWLKLKCTGREEFVIVGYTPPAGARTHLGALLLATRGRASAQLRYAGKVGTGFSASTLRELRTRLLPLRRATPACEDAPHGYEAKNAQWVEPRLVAEVSFTEMTSDGRLRHPSFQGLREDKPPSAVIRERKPSPLSARTRRGR